LFFGLRSV